MSSDVQGPDRGGVAVGWLVCVSKAYSLLDLLSSLRTR